MAVALHYADDRSIEEIAVVLGCAPGTVKTHLHRARLTLHARLSQRDTDG
jgi:RNA polymerase sigma-70 factor (ECF subfamily)